MVYVVNRKGKPLMPTKRYGKVRRLLKSGLAVPICNNPFTIKLKYDTPDIVQELYLGIDVGRENIGIGVSKLDGECVFLSELKTNNKSIKKNMDNRRAFRRARRQHARLRKQRKAIRDGVAFKSGKDDTLRGRPCISRDVSYPKMDKSITCKVIKGAESQFANRKKRCELTPSARQLIQMHMGAVKSVMKFLPISHIIVERNVFDFQKLENQNIRAWEYGKGILYGYKSYKDYIYALQDGKCLLCDGLISQYHHIVPRSRGGSDNASNIVGLCDKCHNSADGVHKSSDMESNLKELKAGLFKKYKIGLLNTVMPFLIEEIDCFCKSNNISFSLTDGYTTYQFREGHNLPKRHSIDGYAISMAGRTGCVVLPDYVYLQQRFKKKSAANIQKLNNREYYFNGKLVAVNRHKAEGQASDSLEEYMSGYAITHDKNECVRHLSQLSVKPAKRTCLAHRSGLWHNIHAGDVVKYEKHNKIKDNIKQMVFVATGVSVLKEVVEHGTKNKKLKFCRTLSSSCIPYINKAPI